MEKFEPKKKRSPIESLKFQRKSDYKKFRNFIKKETEELKGIVAPKQDKFKNLLKVGVGGFGLLGIGGLFGSKLKGKGTGEGPNVFPFAIGRRYSSPPPTITGGGPTSKKPGPLQGGKKMPIGRSARKAKRIRKFLKTKVTSSVDKKIKVGAGKTKVTFSTTPDKAEVRNARKILKKFNDSAVKTLKNNIKEGQDILKKIKDAELGIKTDDVFMDVDGTFVDSFDKLSPRGQELANKPELTKSTQEIKIDPKKLVKPEQGGSGLVDKKGGFNTTTVPDNYTKIKKGFAKDRLTERVTDVVSKNPYRRNALLKNRFMKKFFGVNQKITGEGTFLKRFSSTNILGKGKVSALAGSLVKNPLVKAGLFVLDAYAAYREGKKVFNFKDNLAFALYDLGVSINNEIFKNDPSKLKVYVSESSDENIRVKQFLRNQKIIKMKQQAQGGGGGNSVIVVPENKQENQVNSTIPIKKGGDEISFVPFEPLNSVGSDILLHKLNQ
tara:strand:- start:87 stop:1571 length:1485 start_codon:yes stop_codon:yes gene_type:complete